MRSVCTQNMFYVRLAEKKIMSGYHAQLSKLPFFDSFKTKHPTVLDFTYVVETMVDKACVKLHPNRPTARKNITVIKMEVTILGFQ